MPSIIKYYVKTIDFISLKTGRATMYLVFVMMFILILSFVTRNIINIPLIWIIEMAQFVMTGYYLLGGGYSMLTDDHVRMDLIYSKLKDKTYTFYFHNDPLSMTGSKSISDRTFLIKNCDFKFVP